MYRSQKHLIKNVGKLYELVHVSISHEMKFYCYGFIEYVKLKLFWSSYQLDSEFETERERERKMERAKYS